LPLIIGGILLIALAIGGFFFWRYSQTYENTDDAQIDGRIHMVSSRVAGTVTRVNVMENQTVNAGDILVELDPRDYQIALQRAEANLAQAQAQVRAEQPAVPITQTTTQTRVASARSGLAAAQAGLAGTRQELAAAQGRILEAEANYNRTRSDLERYTILVKKDEVSRQEYDARVAAERVAAATLESARATAEAIRRGIEQRQAAVSQAQTELEGAATNAPQQLSQQRAAVELRQAGTAVARAAVEEASLNLSYTRITAPISGLVGRRNVEVGSRVQPGQQLVSVIPLEDIWVTANFKETQLAHMRPGQRVTIHVDAFDQDFEGYVESMPPATAARYSILPPENASGNYVKVVQRLPVRIRLKPGQDPEHRLRPGMSVGPKVWVK
jgi:membrane fusion protein (multidrug efflux system)